jgi:hypothetical protein
VFVLSLQQEVHIRLEVAGQLEILLGFLNDLELALLEQVLNLLAFGSQLREETNHLELGFGCAHGVGLEDDALESTVVLVIEELSHKYLPSILVDERTGNLSLVVVEGKLH